VPVGNTGLTLDGTTIDSNPASQFLAVDFVQSGVGSANNVTFTGTSSSFVWFRDGVNDLYGEAFDAGDGDPGAIRWDDSNYQIDISGTVYDVDGVTPLGGPTCDGSTPVVRVVVDDGTYTDTVSCDGSGQYTFTNVSYNGDPRIVVYLDTDGGAQASVVTKTPTNDIADLDLVANRVITRHEDAAPLSIADMVLYDEDDDSDIRFVAATGTPDTLIVRPDTELRVASSTSFVPQGNITLQSAGSGTEYDGTLRLAPGASFTAATLQTHTIGGSLIVDQAGVLTVASSSVNFTATTSGKTVTASTTLVFGDISFTGSGAWNLNTPLTVTGDITVASGTLTGTEDIYVSNGSFAGNGVVSLGGGTVTIASSTVLGGTASWTFANLTLGDGLLVGTTTRASNATTTVSEVLTVAAGHTLDAQTSAWELSGTGTVFVEDGTFAEGTGSVTYSGNSAAVLATDYYDVRFAPLVGTPTYTFPAVGIQVANDLVIAGAGAATVDLDANDPVVAILGNVTVGVNGTLATSDTTPLTLAGDYINNGTLLPNTGEIRFTSGDAYTIDAGTSSFADLTITGSGAGTFVASATSTGAVLFASTSDVTVDAGTTLAFGGTAFIETVATDWTGATLYLYGTETYTLNPKTNVLTLPTIVAAGTTNVRTWNLNTTAITTGGSAAIYSQDHASVDGDLVIYGTYTPSTQVDHWSYATDFDGADLSGVERAVSVRFATSSQAIWSGGGLYVQGTSTATTSVTALGSTAYGIEIGGTTNSDWSYASVRGIDGDGITFNGTPVVNQFDYVDLEVGVNSGTAMTVAGSAINASPARNFTGVIFNAAGGVSGAHNVTATGASVSGWRFTSHSGNLDGEANDVDPAGDPGYIIWDDSADIITISGNVYEADETTVSGVCDGSTTNIVLAVAGSTAQNASSSCAASDGAYSISGVSFNASDELMLYIDGEAVAGITVTKDPVSSIGDMDIYERHVIVRHESTAPLTIADMAVWDSSDDADIPYTATAGSPDSLTLPADIKLLLWNGKEFAPDGNITVTGNGVGDAVDGSLEARPGATFTGTDGDVYVVGGDMVFAASANFAAASSTVEFDADGAGRTITVNDDAFYNASFTGTGAWSFTDTVTTITHDLAVTSGSVTFVSGTTTVGGSFTTTGSFDANNGVLLFTSNQLGETVTFNGSAAEQVQFTGLGSWAMNDVNVTIDQTFTVATGTVTLPSGTLSVGGDFTVLDAIAANSGTVALTATNGTTTVTLSNNDLHTLDLTGGAVNVFTDESATLLGDLSIDTDTLYAPTNTLAIGGSYDATLGTFVSGTGTVLFNASSLGHTVTPGSNTFYNVVFSGVGGGWTVASATSTNNYVIQNGASYTQQPSSAVLVAGVFTNNLGGAATTWTNSSLSLQGSNAYEINDRTDAGDVYDTLVIGANSDIRSWYSSAVTPVVASSSSWYSQDHNNSDGTLAIYGDLSIATSTEYWSYDTDFDGTGLGGGSERGVSVLMATSATTTIEATGTLVIAGASDGTATTTIASLGSATYNLRVADGTINWNRYSFGDMAVTGVTVTSTPTIIGLDYGTYAVGINGGTAISLSKSALDANPSLTILDNQFVLAPPASSANNVTLAATSTNSWRFVGATGAIAGEDFDADGVTDCGSIRWDDSSCLLTEQTSYRWRYDDGGIGVPDSEWFAADFTYRQQIRVANNDNQSYTDVVVPVTIPYDANMQSDFDDLRVTLSDGVTATPFWVETIDTSAEAGIWVQLPSLPADDTARLFVYYGSSTAQSISTTTGTFTAIDDFEDNNISEYSGDTGQFQTDTNFDYNGVYGLAADDPNDFTSNGIARFDQTVAQGDTVRAQVYVDAGSGDADEVCTMFGVQSPVTAHENYGLCFIQFGTERVSLVRDVERNDTFGGVVSLASTNYNFTTSGWYEFEVDWGTDNTLFASVYDPSGALVATTSATDSTYTSGGYGYTYWTNNGGWDSFHARPTITTPPSVFLGARQTAGGATYAAAQNTQTTAFSTGESARLRVAVENTGLDITDQEFRLEYSAKGAAPSCAAVADGNYATVPTDSGCGASPICMATSSFVTNGVATSDLLDIDRNTFVAGAYVEDPSNTTAAIDVDQNQYTELEYTLRLTNNVSDQSYCFRVTDAGVTYDSYINIPELRISFDPVVSGVTLNDGADISLLPGTTTRVYATGTATDLNGYTDLVLATSTMFDVAVGASCTPDDNNCYVQTVGSQCSYANCSGNTCDLICYADFAYHANPTDVVGDWYAFFEVEDTAGGYDFSTSPPVDVATLRALSVTDAIDYGALAPQSDTGSNNATTTAENIGNSPIDILVSGSDLTDGFSSVIPVNQQKLATSSFSYSACVSCTNLSTSTAPLEVDLAKPTAQTPPVTDDIYWGIAIPFGINSAPHTGTNTFYATDD
jgi:hypothetical protein